MADLSTRPTRRGDTRRLVFVVTMVVLLTFLLVTHRLPGALQVQASTMSASDLHVPPQPPFGGQWAFEQKQDGKPVGYNPCRELHYRIHLGNGPLNGVLLVQQGIEKLRAATGLTFVYDGPTDTIPTTGTAYRPDSPIWVGWARADETDLWAANGGDNIAGLGGSSMVTGLDGKRVYTTGYALMRPDNSLPPMFSQGENEGAVLLHELGHVVGLDHVADEREIMHGGVTPFSGDGYGPGDLNGLWLLGASRGCL